MTSEPPASRQPKPRAVTIGRLLGATGCFAILFALIVHVQNLGFWFLWLSVPPLVGGIHGTYRNGIKGFLEGAITGALLLPLYLLLLFVVLLWIFLASLVWSSMGP